MPVRARTYRLSVTGFRCRCPCILRVTFADILLSTHCYPNTIGGGRGNKILGGSANNVYDLFDDSICCRWRRSDLFDVDLRRYEAPQISPFIGACSVEVAILSFGITASRSSAGIYDVHMWSSQGGELFLGSGAGPVLDNTYTAPFQHIRGYEGTATLEIIHP